MSVANDKGDNEMIPGAVQRSPGICLTAEENPGNPQLGYRLKGLCDQLSPQMGSLQVRSAGSHSTSGREKEGLSSMESWAAAKKSLS